GQTEDAREIIREHGEKLRLRKLLVKRQRQLSALTARMKVVERSQLPGEIKRRRLDLLKLRKAKLVESVRTLKG
ncbi:MAG: hypothetical protein OIF57_00890, partial [Marinobacterium sp.]|nr:hypothetical protein [Marinobacterium sp.]